MTSRYNSPPSRPMTLRVSTVDVDQLQVLAALDSRERLTSPTDLVRVAIARYIDSRRDEIKRAESERAAASKRKRGAR